MLRVEGYVGSGNRGDIAIDDFAIYNRSCSGVTRDIWAVSSEQVYSAIKNMTGSYPPYAGNYPGQGEYTMKERICYGKSGAS